MDMSTVGPAICGDTSAATSESGGLSLRDMEWWLSEFAGLLLENCPSCNREQLEPGQLVCR